MTKHQLPYDLKRLKREKTPHYIMASENEIESMLKSLKLNKLEDLYAHLPENYFFKKESQWTTPLIYDDLIDHVTAIAAQNRVRTTFIGDGLKHYKIPAVINEICNIRGLTTAYTPYQPERSQGTLQSLWIYTSMLSQLTGFEAINASMYDRATALFEAIKCAERLGRARTRALVCDSIYPGDKEVLATLAQGTSLVIDYVPIHPRTGATDFNALEALIAQHGQHYSCLVFPQISSLGSLEEVDRLTDLARDHQMIAVAVIDPMLLGEGGLKSPSRYGRDGKGAHIIVGEGQPVALAPGFGGPGIGIFGVRYNEHDRTTIRSTPGRYVGKGKDRHGRVCKTLILSTREQHIRREKATSNICSNQSFIATLVGAALLARGGDGLKRAAHESLSHAQWAAKELTSWQGVELAFPDTPFFNEFTLRLPIPAAEVIRRAREFDLHVGVDVSARLGDGQQNALMLYFSDAHSPADLQKLFSFFGQLFTQKKAPANLPPLTSEFLRHEPAPLLHVSEEPLLAYYRQLGELNLSPDDNIYALGSCTMKYNPYVNDYLAGLPGFTHLHPQAPEEDCQGSLRILYEIQEMFKGITGLAAVATQPLAGAQGELVGIKLFQAYHRDRGEGEQRNVIIIPKTAHGTNPATASYAGLETKVVGGVAQGIITLGANSKGEIDFAQLQTLVAEYGSRIAGIMVTNPNTSGIFETTFSDMAELIHSVGGLVYMDGANMNAIAGHVDLERMGVDAVHNNLHKTWSISHGGGGPGDAIVAVSKRLENYVPGIQVSKVGETYSCYKASKSIGSFHRHFGNFLHKVRCYSYLKALGPQGVKRMAAMAVLSARYLHNKLSPLYPTLPEGTLANPRMHEFIMTLTPALFSEIEKAGIPRSEIIAKIGKLFLDFGIHAPTVAFPEVYGLMVEPTESYSKSELDRFVDTVKAIHLLLSETPQILATVPHFTPVDKVDEVDANKVPVLNEQLTELPHLYSDRLPPSRIQEMSIGEICKAILNAHREAMQK